MIGLASDAEAAGGLAPLWLLVPAGILAISMTSVPDSALVVAGNASLLLLMGGLSILALIVGLVLLQSFFPVRVPTSVDRHHAPRPRQLRPLRGFPSPPPASVPAPAPAVPPAGRPAVDRPMEQIVEAGLGEPRILRHRPHFTILRLYFCRSCDPSGHHSSKADPDTGCSAERTAIEARFREALDPSAVVREAACRLRGDPECDFEVRH